MHSRKYREYCTHSRSTALDKVVATFLAELNRFQLAALQRNALKAKARKRYVLGFNEVMKKLKVQKVKVVIVAPDLEPNNLECTCRGRLAALCSCACVALWELTSPLYFSLACVLSWARPHAQAAA